MLCVLGHTLYQTCELLGIDLGPMSKSAPEITPHTETWSEPTFGEGPTSGFDHVVISGPGVDKVPPITYYEQQMLEDYWDDDEIFSGSRLANCVTLQKEMQNMIVYIPDRLVDDVP
jgi:hypothetical protein